MVLEIQPFHCMTSWKTFIFMYVCPLDVLHGTHAHLNMSKMDSIMGKEALQEFGRTRRQVSPFAPTLKSELRLHNHMSEFLLLIPIFSSLYLLSPLLPHASFILFHLLKPTSSSCLSIHHQMPCALLGCLCSHCFCHHPSIHSSFPFHTPSSSSSLLFGQLIPDLTSPMSASITSLLAYQVLPPSTSWFTVSALVSFSRLFIPAFLMAGYALPQQLHHLLPALYRLVGRKTN